MPIPERPTESRAGDVLLLPIAGLAFWTLAYDLVLILRWPTKTIMWCFLAVALAGFFLLGRLWKRSNAIPGQRYRFHPSQSLLVALGLICAITVLFVRRPNQDDMVYFHRALTQLSDIDPACLNALLPHSFTAAPIDGDHNHKWSYAWRYDRRQALALIERGLEQSLPVYALVVSSDEAIASPARLPNVPEFEWRMLGTSSGRAAVLKLAPAGPNETAPAPE